MRLALAMVIGSLAVVGVAVAVAFTASGGGEDVEGGECGPNAGCAKRDARAVPAWVRGAIALRVTLAGVGGEAPVRFALTGPGGPDCAPVTVRRRTTLAALDRLTPRSAFGRRTWCPGAFRGVLEHRGERHPFAFRAAPPPPTRTVAVAAREFALFRRAARPADRLPAQVAAVVERRAGSEPLIGEARALPRIGGVAAWAVPAGHQLCLVARGDVLCRTPTRAAGRTTLTARTGSAALGLLPDGAGDVVTSGHRHPRVTDGGFAFVIPPGERISYYAADGKKLRLRLPAL